MEKNEENKMVLDFKPAKITTTTSNHDVILRNLDQIQTLTLDIQNKMLSLQATPTPAPTALVPSSVPLSVPNQIVHKKIKRSLWTEFLAIPPSLE